MAQVTIYLDEDTESRLDQAVKVAGVSRSRWVANLIRDKIRDEWPDSFRELVGSWGADFPEIEDLRAEMGTDIERDSL